MRFKQRIAIISWGADESQIERVKSIISVPRYYSNTEYVVIDINNTNVTNVIAVLVVIGDNILHVLANNGDDCYLNEKKQLAYFYNHYHRFWSYHFFVVTNANWERYLAHYTCMNLFAIVRRSYVSYNDLGNMMQIIYERDFDVVNQCLVRCGDDHWNYSYDNEFEKVVNKSKSNCFASVFAPEKVMVRDYLLVQVYIYKNSNHNIVVETAKRSDDNKTKERHQVLLDYNINYGDIINVTLDLYPDCYFFGREKDAVLMDEYALASFEVKIPSDFEYDKLRAKVLISVNEATICQMNFTTKIVKKSMVLNYLWSSGSSGDVVIYTNMLAKIRTKLAEIFKKVFILYWHKKLAKITSRCFKRPFISYSHKDADKIKYLAEAYRAIGVDYFYDRHSLRGGDVFDEKIQEAIQSSDLFILCWSANAAESNYIKKEIDTALPLAYPQFKPQEAAPLSIYPLSIEPSAPPPENLKSIYNFVKI